VDWDDLKVFLALARQGSLSATARTLRVEHSTVARRIAALEQALGVRLFDRMARGYLPTAEGERLIGPAERLEAEAFAVERSVGDAAGGLAGSVRITAPPNFATHFLAPRLASIRSHYPAIRIELVGASRAASLTRREADLAIRLSRPEDGGLIVRKLGILGMGVFASRQYLNGRVPADFDYLGYDDSLEHLPQQRWILDLAGDRPLAVRANDLTTIIHAAKAGLGAAALPIFVAEQEPSLARLPHAAETLDREIWLLVHPDLSRSPRIRAVMDLVIGWIEGEKRLLAGR